MNNLKQIGIALQHFESVSTALPAGYVSQFTADGTDTGPGWGWGALLLDYLEEVRCVQLRLDLPIEAAANMQNRLVSVAVYLCPSDTAGPVWSAYQDIGAATPQNKICDLASANYVAMFGDTEPGIDGTGLFFRNSAVRVAKSPTARHRHSPWESAFTYWAKQPGLARLPELSWHPARATTMASASSRLNTVLPWCWDTPAKYQPGDPAGDVNMFYSQHPGGVNFVFADVHVAFLPTEMDPKTFEALSTRAGGEMAEF